MERKVTRADLIALLTRWQQREIAAADVHAWAEARFLPGDTEFDDEEPDFGSAAAEVLSRLDMLDQHLIIPEDIPLYLALLQSPQGELAAAMTDFDARQAAIDFRARSSALRTTEPYARYLRGGRQRG